MGAGVSSRELAVIRTELTGTERQSVQLHLVAIGAMHPTEGTDAMGYGHALDALGGDIEAAIEGARLIIDQSEADLLLRWVGRQHRCSAARRSVHRVLARTSDRRLR